MPPTPPMTSRRQRTTNLITFNRPATDSLWRDEVLHITYQVLGIDGQEALVRCSSGVRNWNDAIDLSLFGTELVEI
jgi:hypothetical protein